MITKVMKKGVCVLVTLAMALAWVQPVGAIVLDTVTAMLEGRMAAFGSFSGQILEIDGDRVYLEDAEAGSFTFVMTERSYVPAGVDLAPGMFVRGYYDTSLPAPMIYPPQMQAMALVPVAAPDALLPTFFKLDRFDDDLSSLDGMLRLEIGADTVIVLEDGTPFELFGQSYQEALAGRALLVSYDVSTRSIPAVTTPTRIVVFFEQAVHPIMVLEPTDLLPLFPERGTLVNLIIEGDIVGEVPLEYTDDGIVMVPIFMVAPALGIELEWDAATRTAIADGHYRFVIDTDEYLTYSGETISLGTAPTIINDRTHVPLAFFREVMNFNNAYFHFDFIAINNFELME